MAWLLSSSYLSPLLFKILVCDFASTVIGIVILILDREACSVSSGALAALFADAPLPNDLLELDFKIRMKRIVY